MRRTRNMTKMIALIFSIIGLCFAGAPVSSEAQDDLKFGVYTADKPTEVVKMFRPVLNAIERGLAERLGRPVKISMEVADSYERGIDDIVSGRVHFSRLGPVSYAEAKKKNPKISVLAIESEDGTKVFYGIICVHRDSLIRHVADLKGKRFAFGDELSTIGRYLSQNLLFQNGIKAPDLSYYEYLARHDKVGEAVGAGRFDAGALKENTFNKLVKKGVAIRSLARFPNVTKPWIAVGDMPQELKEALKAVLLDIKDPVVLQDLGNDGFLEGDDKDYDEIRQAVEINAKFFE